MNPIPTRTSALRPLCAVATLSLCCALLGAAQPGFDLAKDGKALAPIVVSAEASPDTRATAADLAQILARVTGAEFAVEDGDGSRGIVLGTIAQFPDPALAKPLELRGLADGKEALVIRSDAKRLRLIGATELGARHAAYRLLEEIGCRWFAPAPEWEVLPKLPTLRVALTIDDRPAVLSRSIWFEAGSGSQKSSDEYHHWKRRNRMAESFSSACGHAHQNLHEEHGRYHELFRRNPQYFAMIDGKRQGPQLELADPQVRKMLVDEALAQFAANPGLDMVSVEPADGAGHSTSPESLALGSVSDRVFGMANEVAKAVAKKYPGKMVGMLAYNAHSDPPTFDLEPNVHIQMTSAFIYSKYSHEERMRLWLERCTNFGQYEYYSVWLWSFDRLPGTWTNNVLDCQGRIRGLLAGGCTSISAESTSSWGSNQLGYLMATRLMWNPNLDAPKAIQEFYDLAYGPASPAMKRYYERFCLGESRATFSRQSIALMFQDMKEATTLAAERPDVLARLALVKLYLRYVTLDFMQREAGNAFQSGKGWTALMTYLYRTRETGLTSWEMIRQDWGKNMDPGRELVEWMSDEPYTAEEIESDFEEGLEYFTPREMVAPVTFSQDLVAVAWDAALLAGEPAETEHLYQGPQTYALWSVKGEPLEFTTKPGMATNAFVLSDGSRKEIERGVLDGKKPTHHRIKVPGPGLYLLDYDNDGYWSITVPVGRTATVPLGNKRAFHNTVVMQDMYFYVPKGTTRFEYLYSRTTGHPGGPHQVLDSAGKVVKNVDVDGDWVTVDVPAGMDGTLWRFHEPVLGFFWFNNLPNYLAASPQALLVPRELAEKDGLKLQTP
ncbi:MAG: DUF4838 domain-containing protein [Planctomycetes bacterium]|nr:DUF4838 domain-containing protein [Planctomycetota bacterium]